MNCTWDDWWIFGLNDLGGSLVSWTSDVKAVWVNLKGDRIRHSQWPCSLNPGKHVLEPILPRGEIKCSAGFSASCCDKTPWKQLRRKGVYLALSSRVQFPGRESWLQGFLEVGHDASQIRKQSTVNSAAWLRFSFYSFQGPDLGNSGSHFSDVSSHLN